MFKFSVFSLFIICNHITAADDAIYRKPTISFSPVSGRNFICYYSSEKTLEIINSKEKKIISVAMPDRVISMVSTKDYILVSTLDGKILVVDERGEIICSNKINGLIISTVSVEKERNMHFAILVSVEDGKIEQELKCQVWYCTVENNKLSFKKMPDKYSFGSLNYSLGNLWHIDKNIAKKISYP